MQHKNATVVASLNILDPDPWENHGAFTLHGQGKQQGRHENTTYESPSVEVNVANNGTPFCGMKRTTRARPNLDDPSTKACTTGTKKAQSTTVQGEADLGYSQSVVALQQARHLFGGMPHTHAACITNIHRHPRQHGNTNTMARRLRLY